MDDEAALAARLDHQPPDLDAHFKAAALHLVNDEYEQALQALIVILRADREFDKGAARRGLLAVFDTLGGDHELVKRYRGELARLIH